MGRLILVSRRLPLKESASGLEKSSGGLVAALGPLHERGDSLWIGTLGSRAGRAVERELEERRWIQVPLRSRDARREYEGFSNGTLWPLFHYLASIVRFDRREFEAYQHVNRAFADAVVARARPGDTIWVHDYHLMLLPALLRERLPDARIGFFLHIPFPSSEIYRILPVADELLRGLLGADLLGVHTFDYARHLVTCFRRLLGIEFDQGWQALDESRARIGVFPLGVDVDALERLAASAPVERRLRTWKRQVGKRKVLLGVDRLDYTKGLLLRMSTYRRLLELEPEWREQAQFVQIVVPSRDSIPSYQQEKSELERLVGEINGAFATQSNVPIRYLYRSVPPEELAALYRLADVALVTPLRDGMNLVAKEYVASCTDDRGALVLSEFAGAACELGDAVLVNPWDIEGTARAIDRALRAEPHEQERRMRALRRRIRTHDVQHWGSDFLAALAELHGRVRESDSRAWIAELRAAFRAAQCPLVLLDFDGTLVGHAPEPAAVVLDPGLLVLLGRLAERATVVVISGRDRRSLERWLGALPVHLVAEHGLFFRARGSSSWEELLLALDPGWGPAVRPVLEEYVARTPGSAIEEKELSMSWHYRGAEPAHGRRQALELAHHLTESFAQSALEVVHGSYVVEIRPQGVNKGRAFQRLVRTLGPFDLVLAAGDDRSDEDLFRTLSPEDWSIKIGPGFTDARARLPGSGELLELLAALAEPAPADKAV